MIFSQTYDLKGKLGSSGKYLNAARTSDRHRIFYSQRDPIVREHSVVRERLIVARTCDPRENIGLSENITSSENIPLSETFDCHENIPLSETTDHHRIKHF